MSEPRFGVSHGPVVRFSLGDVMNNMREGGDGLAGLQ